VNHDPGTHNYERDNREAFYRFLGDHFYPETSGFDATEVPCDDELKSADALEVPLPTDNADFSSLATQLSRDLPRNESLPTSPDDAPVWQRTERERLAQIVRAKQLDAEAELAGHAQNGNVTVRYWRLKMAGNWTVPAVELEPAEPTATAVLVTDEGRATSAGQAAELLAKGYRVVAIDPFYFGESRPTGPDSDVCYALLLSVVGDRPLGLQSGQVSAVARWLRGQRPEENVSIVCHGRRAGVVGLVAAALETDAIASVELHGALGSLKQLIEGNETVDAAPELFCFGLLERFDVKQLAALVAPRPVVVREPSDRARQELAGIRGWYSTWGVEHEPLR
jgi:hypothetical protein